MAMDAFLELTGIKGNSRQSKTEGQIIVRGFRHTVGAVMDRSGMPTDEVRPGYLVVVKEFDLATPALHKAMRSDDKIAEGTLRFFRMPPSGGKEENHLSIVMTGLRVVSIAAKMLNNRRQEDSLIPEIEEVAFAYDTIAYAFATGGAEGGTAPKVSGNSGTLGHQAFDGLNQAIGDAVLSDVKSGLTDLGAAIVERMKERAGEVLNKVLEDKPEEGKQ